MKLTSLSSCAGLLVLGLISGCTSATDPAPAVSGAAAGAAICRTASLAVQVLGSGGPIAEGSRAGTSYAVWIDGHARILIDAGPGSFIRFGEAGLKLADLQAIAISHFHADHSAGLAGILNSGSFESVSDPLPLIGPAAGSVFPGTGDFARALVGPDKGAWSYLRGYLDASDGRRVLTLHEVPAQDTQTAPAQRFDIAPGLTLTAIPVHHGVTPALAFVVEAGGRKILFAGDQSAFSAGFDRQTRGMAPALLIAHHPIPEGEGQPIGLHRAPHDIGAMAANVTPALLVLSHNMNRALERLDESRTAIAASYVGKLDIAEDGACYPL